MGSVTSAAALTGDFGLLRVTQGGESMDLPMYHDPVASQWFSEKLNDPISSVDSEFVLTIGSPATDWKYLGSSPSELGKWFLRAGSIPFAGAFIAAGLKLQDRLSARILDTTGVPHWITPFYYEYNDGDTITFSNDVAAQGGKTWNGHADLGFEPSPENIGHGAVLKSDGSSNSKLYTASQYDDGILTSGYHSLTRAGGWDYVKFFTATQPSGAALGGVSTATPYTPVKKYLYPTLYGIGPSIGSGIAAISYEVRWTT